MNIRNNIAKGVVVPFSFGQINVAASQTDVALVAADPSGNDHYPVPWDGGIVAIAASASAAVTAGTLSITVTLDGTKIASGATLNFPADSATLATSLKIPRTNAAFRGNRKIGVKITTSGAFAPTTTDLSVVVYALQSLDGI